METRPEILASDIIYHSSYFYSHGMLSSAFWLSNLIHPKGKLFCNCSSTPYVEKIGSQLYQILSKAEYALNNCDYRRVISILCTVDDVDIATTLDTFPRAIFLKNYACYLNGEESKSEKINKSNLVQSNKIFLNNATASIRKKLTAIENELEGPGLWLLAVVHRATGHIHESLKAFIKSLRMNCYNWSAWQDFVDLLLQNRPQLRNTLENSSKNVGNILKSKVDDDDCIRLLHNNHDLTFEDFIHYIKIQDHWTARIGFSLLCIRSRRYGPALECLEKVLNIFGHCAFLYSQLAKCAYGMQKYDLSLKFFNLFRKFDPYSLDYVEELASIYKNMENSAALISLSRKCQEIDKYSAATCCVIGICFSTLKKYYKAEEWFLQATLLDKGHTTSRVFLGHQFRHTGRYKMALAPYQAVLDIDRTDARAWHGLGKVYEMHDDLNAAMYHYEQACFYSADDHRFWMALGECQQKRAILNRAIGSFKQAWFYGQKLEALIMIYTSFKKQIEKNEATSEQVFLWALKLYERFLQEACSKFSSTDYETLHQMLIPEACVDKSGNINREAASTLQHVTEAFRGAPPEILDAIHFLMKYNYERGSFVEMRRFALLLCDSTGEQAEEAKRYIQSYDSKKY